jgi:hypothetical protein
VYFSDFYIKLEIVEPKPSGVPSLPPIHHDANSSKVIYPFPSVSIAFRHLLISFLDISAPSFLETRVSSNGSKKPF